MLQGLTDVFDASEASLRLTAALLVAQSKCGRVLRAIQFRHPVIGGRLMVAGSEL